MLREAFDEDIEYSTECLPETICAMSNSCGGSIRYDGEVIDVPPLVWYRKPAIHDGKVYRRIEGENVISGAWARSVMATHDFSCDDYPTECVLDWGQVSAFRETVISRHDEYGYFAQDEFLRRTGICSGKYLTFAGALMFGNCVSVRAVLDHHGVSAEASARSIWMAYTDLLPRLTCRLASECSALFREAYINALLHSDYTINTNINITITSAPPKAIIDNPGLIRGDTRNYRLKRMFNLAGITNHHNEVITLKQDMLNFRTNAIVFLFGLPKAIIL